MNDTGSKCANRHIKVCALKDLLYNSTTIRNFFLDGSVKLLAEVSVLVCNDDLSTIYNSELP